MVTRLTFKEEREARNAGFSAIIGVDEVGVGPLAGPVVAAAVWLPEQFPLKGLNDSKKLTEKKRVELSDYIKKTAIAYSVAQATVAEINELGIRPANLLACRRAVEGIDGVEFVLVDAWTIPNIPYPQKGLIKGDSFVPSIAAASVLAKVVRDAIMVEYDKKFPVYGFAGHKGYGTKVHMEAITEHGPCLIHRTSWEVFKTL